MLTAATPLKGELTVFDLGQNSGWFQQSELRLWPRMIWHKCKLSPTYPWIRHEGARILMLSMICCHDAPAIGWVRPKWYSLPKTRCAGNTTVAERSEKWARRELNEMTKVGTSGEELYNRMKLLLCQTLVYELCFNSQLLLLSLVILGNCCSVSSRRKKFILTPHLILYWLSV